MKVPNNISFLPSQSMSAKQEQRIESFEKLLGNEIL